jgi:hypothetical protein
MESGPGKNPVFIHNVELKMEFIVIIAAIGIL